MSKTININCGDTGHDISHLAIINTVDVVRLEVQLSC